MMPVLLRSIIECPLVVAASWPLDTHIQCTFFKTRLHIVYKQSSTAIVAHLAFDSAYPPLLPL